VGASCSIGDGRWDMETLRGDGIVAISPQVPHRADFGSSSPLREGGTVNHATDRVAGLLLAEELGHSRKFVRVLRGLRERDKLELKRRYRRTTIVLH
jgi:hypothetical protein